MSTAIAERIEPLDEGCQFERQAVWPQVCRQALAKMISELTYEEVLAPEPGCGASYVLLLASGIAYEFEADVMAWGNLWVEEDSIRRVPMVDGYVSPLQFTIDAAQELGMRPETIATFLRELSNTLRQDMVLQERWHGLSGEELAGLEPPQMHSLLEGHPKAVANKGRLGWGAADLERYSPESGSGFEILWIAARRANCLIGREPQEDEQAFLLETLGPADHARLMDIFQARGLGWADYTVMPVHPWQWDHLLEQAYISDLMAGDIVLLGEFGGAYLAGPSLRTVTSLDRPGSPDLKLALTILNTSAWRGIPGKYIQQGPALSQWLAGIVVSDPELAGRVTILMERYGIWYRHPLYEQLPESPYQHQESLGAIWRDNAKAHLKENQQAYLYAALLHPDEEGVPMAAIFAGRSGLTLEDWMAHLFTATVAPLYHLLCKYGVGFIAHGQNLTVVLEKDIPVGVAIKDLQGDVDLVNRTFPEQADLPDAIRSVLAQKPPEYIVHNIQTGHFVTVLRFLSARLAKAGKMTEARFYQLLRDSLDRYMAAHPALSDRFDLFDLLKPTLPRVCINKVRFEIGYEDSGQRPLPGLGTDLVNPLFEPEGLAS